MQFMCSKENNWTIEKDRVTAFDGSAGEQTCMCLAFSNDMAKPDSQDPVERKPTWLTCAATAGAAGVE